jgi:Ankyrin repeats (3 copies)
MQKFFSGNKDSDRLILERLNDRDLLTTCSVGKYALELCNEDFFKKRLMKRYPGSVGCKNVESWKQCYLSTVYYVSKMKEESNFEFKTGDPKAYYDILHNNLRSDIFFERVGEINAKDLYEIYSKDRSVVYTAYAMKGASKKNHKDFIEYLIKKGKNYENNLLNLGLEGATESNNIELINFFIDKGADKFNNPLFIASKKGNIKLVDFFIDKGGNDLNQAMAHAARENQKEMVEHLIEKGANDFKLALVGSASGGNLELFKYIIKEAKGIEVSKNFFTDVLSRQVNDGRIGLVKTVNGEGKYDEVDNYIEELRKKLFG